MPVVTRITSKISSQSRPLRYMRHTHPISIQNRTHNALVKSRTVLYFKGQLATLLAKQQFQQEAKTKSFILFFAIGHKQSGKYAALWVCHWARAPACPLKVALKKLRLGALSKHVSHVLALAGICQFIVFHFSNTLQIRAAIQELPLIRTAARVLVISIYIWPRLCNLHQQAREILAGFIIGSLSLHRVLL